MGGAHICEQPAGVRLSFSESQSSGKSLAGFCSRREGTNTSKVLEIKDTAEMKGNFLPGKAILWEVSATTQASRALFRVRQKGSLIQYDSGAGVCSNIENLTLGSLF